MNAHSLSRRILRATRILVRPFSGSREYWENRYAGGDTSGHGSAGDLARFKAAVVNDQVTGRGVQSVIEFGCGDGAQLELFSFPQYLGLDVSATALAHCHKAFSNDPTKEFRHLDDYEGEQADMALSLDVIQHLVEDSVFETYMGHLFESARTCVIIYTGDFDDYRRFRGSHIRYRKFTSWVEQYAPRWTLVEHVRNPYPRRRGSILGSARGSLSELFVFAPQQANQTSS